MFRLLHVRTKEFKEFYDLESVPLYAILSHRWVHAQRNGRYRALEISHAEFLAGTGDERGYEKVDKACEAVRDLSEKLERDLQWIWIDSCCIDKNNNDEHTEAINSMYEWYARSYVCLAYMDSADPFDESSPSEWFKRGWTLQELIAPERILFYNQDWIGCGSRNGYSPGPYGSHSFEDRSTTIAAITRIDATLLKLTKRRDIKRRLDVIPACQKMSWASDRRTTKDEDMAYCLIGIFDIPHMHLKRGEGRRAFIRLQEEIIKQSNDLTLFAWKLSGDERDACMEENCLTLEDVRQGAPEDDVPFFDSALKSDLHGVFACSPGHFRESSRVEPTQLAIYSDEIVLTSKGVKLTTPLLGSGPFFPFKMPLYCTDEGSSELLSMELRLLGGYIYARTNCTQLPRLHQDENVIPSQDDVFLAHNIHRLQDSARQMHKHSIRLPDTILNMFRRVHVSPGYLWSSKHGLVITNGCRFFVGYATYRSYKGPDSTLTLLFGLDHLERPWFCLSNADKSFEPHGLESRKQYLERVWRPASRHTKTAYLDDEKKLFIDIKTPSGMLGTMRALRQEYHGHTIFDIEFEYGWRGLPIARTSAQNAVSGAETNDSTTEPVTDQTDMTRDFSPDKWTDMLPTASQPFAPYEAEWYGDAVTHRSNGYMVRQRSNPSAFRSEGKTRMVANSVVGYSASSIYSGSDFGSNHGHSSLASFSLFGENQRPTDGSNEAPSVGTPYASIGVSPQPRLDTFSVGDIEILNNPISRRSGYEADSERHSRMVSNEQAELDELRFEVLERRRRQRARRQEIVSVPQPPPYVLGPNATHGQDRELNESLQEQYSTLMMQLNREKSFEEWEREGQLERSRRKSEWQLSKGLRPIEPEPEGELERSRRRSEYQLSIGPPPIPVKLEQLRHLPGAGSEPEERVQHSGHDPALEIIEEAGEEAMQDEERRRARRRRRKTVSFVDEGAADQSSELLLETERLPFASQLQRAFQGLSQS